MIFEMDLTCYIINAWTLMLVLRSSNFIVMLFLQCLKNIFTDENTW